jgi:hypothetical protein
MSRKGLIIAGAVAAAMLLSMLGWGWIKAATDSYDQRYEDCMNQKQAQLYPQGHYFPDNAYNEAMRQCEIQAGVPIERTTPFPTPAEGSL